VAGLKTGDSVEIAGVKVGGVESISLAEDRGRLGLRIQDQVKLEEDVIASVRARGLIGDKFVLITPGASEKIIPPGGKIRETESPPDLPDLLAKIIGGDLTSTGDKAADAEKNNEIK
jgi:phospholipid/cholesterol/gamma-HCH transport system substrate-binding protein